MAAAAAAAAGSALHRSNSGGAGQLWRWNSLCSSPAIDYGFKYFSFTSKD